MRRLGDLLPQAAAALGIDEEYRRARATAAWERAVSAVVPAACGSSRLVGFRGDVAVVAAAASIVAQELLLHQEELLAAFAAEPGARRPTELRVVVQPGSGGARHPGAAVWDPGGRQGPGV